MTSRRSLLLCAAILSLSLTGMAGIAFERLRRRCPSGSPIRTTGTWSPSSPSRTASSDPTICSRTRSCSSTSFPISCASRSPSRVYIGVGPEQNFTYIAALKPKMAFIVDIRRGNLQLHLMYKALFEMSADRAEFSVAAVLATKRPEGLGAQMRRAEISSAVYATASTGERGVLYNQNLKAIQEQLTKRTASPLIAEDLQGIEYVYTSFYWYGPGSPTGRPSGRGGGFRDAPTYADLMVADDGNGQHRSFLASEENFRVLKTLAREEPARADRRQLRRPEGAAGRRRAI